VRNIPLSQSQRWQVGLPYECPLLGEERTSQRHGAIRASDDVV
jgi:hypothetical protein